MCIIYSIYFISILPYLFFFFFFFNDTATTEIYTLSLHDALPIWARASRRFIRTWATAWRTSFSSADRKSTRLNSSHGYISYAVFCLKKKKKKLDYTLNNPKKFIEILSADSRMSNSLMLLDKRDDE